LNHRIEKEAGFIDMTWTLNSALLVILAQNSKVYVIQNEQLQKVVTLEFFSSSIWEFNADEVDDKKLNPFKIYNSFLDNEDPNREKQAKG